MEIRDSRRLIEGFAAKYLSGLPGSDVHKHREILHSASRTIYGPIVERYVEATFRPDLWMQSSVPPNKDTVVQGLNFLASAAVRSDATYMSNRAVRNLKADPKFTTELAKLHNNATEGRIELIDEEYGMTPEEGTAQVRFANASLGVLNLDTQAFLAGMNYAAFTANTMSTGMDLIAEAETDLNSWTEGGDQRAMPHLQISNLAIGEMTAAISERVNQFDAPLSIVDMGSGSGGTLARIVIGLEKSIQLGVSPEDVNATGMVVIEVTTPMVRQLAMFSQVAAERLRQATGFEFFPHFERNPQHTAMILSEIGVMHSGIVEGVEALSLDENLREGILLATANYSWHRLPTVSKARIIQSLSAKCPNVIVLVADLVQNASEVNRRYFNFRDNGILNCGNIELERLFKQNGFGVVDLNEETAPDSMNPQLAQQISQGVTTDSIFKIAWAGDMARQILGQ